MSRPLLRDLNSHITCSICHGYLINATTVIDCLHTFCKTCIVKHLDENNSCPQCNSPIHHSHPKDYIRLDRTLQQIVYKVVPELLEKVTKDQEQYEKDHPAPASPVIEEEEDEELTDEELMNGHDENPPPPRPPPRSPVKLHNYNEDYVVPVQVNLHENMLNGDSSDKPKLEALSKPILGCPARCPIRVIKKFVQNKLVVDDTLDLDILCNDEILGKDHTLEFIKMTRWRTKELPLVLTYRIRPDI